MDRTIAWLIGIGIALVIAAPALPQWLAFLLTISLAKGVVVLGLLVLMRAGLVSFGQGLFYGLGAYAAGLSTNLLGVTDIFVLLAIGVVVSGTVAFLLGFLIARYRDIFFAMLNLAFSMVLYGVLVRSSALGSTDGFNLPPPSFAGWLPLDEAGRLAVLAMMVGIATIAATAVHRYLGSALGFVGDAIRGNEIRVEYLGASVRQAIHVKYVIAAASAGAGGVMTAIATGHIDPDLAFWTTSGEFVFVAILSGTGSVAAPLAGMLLFELIRTYAFEYSPYTWQMIIGTVMLVIIVFVPGGLWSLVARGRQVRGG